MEIKVIDEGYLTKFKERLKDNSTFAIIGGRDKDTKEDKSKELWLKSILACKVTNNEHLDCLYIKSKGEPEKENFLFISGISKEKAIEISRGAKKGEDPKKFINQEKIIWKDKDFLGIISTEDPNKDKEEISKEDSIEKIIEGLLKIREIDKTKKIEIKYWYRDREKSLTAIEKKTFLEIEL